MEFALIGKLKTPQTQIESVIKKFGGKVVAKIHDKLAAVISDEDEIKKMGPKMTMAKTYNIQVVSEDFLTNIETTDPYICIISRKISDWGGNVSVLILLTFFLCVFFNKTSFFLNVFHFFQPFSRIEQSEVKSRRETTFYTKSIPEKITYKIESKISTIILSNHSLFSFYLIIVSTIHRK